MSARGEEVAVDTQGTPREIADADFNGVIEGNPYVIVDFWAGWCPPCHALDPVLDELAAEYSGPILFLRMDADANQRRAKQYGVLGLPTLLFFKRGGLVGRVVGSLPKAILRRTIQRLFDCG